MELHMSDLSNLKFPSGRAASQIKKDAKRLKKSSGITLTEALNQCANENGMDLPWDQAINALKRNALFASIIMEEQLYLNDQFKPSKDFFEAINKARGLPPKRSQPSLTIDLSLLSSHVYETLICHPIYDRFIKRFMQLADFDFQVNLPHKVARYKGEDWRFKIKYDGFSGDGDKPSNDIWCEFKEWLMQFGSTQRLNITERIEEPTYSHLVTQSFWQWTWIKFVNKLEFDVDKALYCQMVNSELPFEEVQWLNTDLSKLLELQDQTDSHQATARFEYTLNGETETVTSQTQGSMQDYSVQIRTLQLYTSALNSIMRSHELTKPAIPMKLINIEMGKELFFGHTRTR